MPEITMCSRIRTIVTVTRMPDDLRNRIFEHSDGLARVLAELTAYLEQHPEESGEQ
jgi:hypothetical protein